MPGQSAYMVLKIAKCLRCKLNMVENRESANMVFFGAKGRFAR